MKFYTTNFKENSVIVITEFTDQYYYALICILESPRIRLNSAQNYKVY